MTGVTDVLVVAPHPDDDVIGCGGSIAKHVRDGARVTVVIVIGRERSALDDAVTDAEFAAETEAAAKALGVHRCIRFDEPSRDFTLSRRVHLNLVRVRGRCGRRWSTCPTTTTTTSSTGWCTS
ncbi:PIG-L deacetylase family protein [Streptomyces sp. DHE17-7]|uniref:PIG-L deacetylase family protein n=1 Tax=Streptomyces sp. DHE17-7 TaxID=2759949 RepID=UPI0022EB1B26|nr:PIG-L family deacetylase [Streptomyces sp. DHE17-7]